MRLQHARLWTVSIVAAGAMLAGCASRSPEVHLHRLAIEPGDIALAARPTVPAEGVWQLMLPVTLPQYLDRDAVLVTLGASGLQPLPGQRWAEPLRDAVLRVLQADLARLRGGAPIVTAPVPAGLQPTRQLRVELQAFEATPDRRAVTLSARWSLADPAGTAGPLLQSYSAVVPSTGSDADALVAAHRLALWRLAERIAATR